MGFRDRLGTRGSGSIGRGRRASDVAGGDVLSREAFETLLPCIFHADAVHDEVRGVGRAWLVALLDWASCAF